MHRTMNSNSSEISFEVLRDAWLARYAKSTRKTYKPTITSLYDALKKRGLTLDDPREEEIKDVIKKWYPNYSEKGKRAGLPSKQEQQDQRLRIARLFYDFLIQECGYDYVHNPIQEGYNHG